MAGLALLWPLLVAGGFAIQPPGEFHGNEPVARDGERWLALRVDGNDAALIATTVGVRAVEDQLVDESGERTGLEVSSPGGDKVIAYLRGSGLKAGAVERATVASMDSDGARLPYELTFRAQHYRIASDCNKQPRAAMAEQLQFDCRIVLHGGGKAQVLSTLTGYYEHQATTMSLSDDGGAVLLFAGDLDHDGKLDLIFDTADHYNVSRPTLYLSSPARPDELLHQVAQYQSVGC